MSKLILADKKLLNLNAPVEDLRVEYHNGYTHILYMGLYKGKPRQFVYAVEGEYEITKTHHYKSENKVELTLIELMG